MTPEEQLAVLIRSLDEREAHALNEICRMDEARDRAIKFFWPVGTRVRWKQTTTREVFEAVGVVHEGLARVIDRRPEWILGAKKLSGMRSAPMPADAHELPPGRYAFVCVAWTEHPSLQKRLSSFPLVHLIPVDELEKLP